MFVKKLNLMDLRVGSVCIPVRTCVYLLGFLFLNEVRSEFIKS